MFANTRLATRIVSLTLACMMMFSAFPALSQTAWAAEPEVAVTDLTGGSSTGQEPAEEAPAAPSEDSSALPEVQESSSAPEGAGSTSVAPEEIPSATNTSEPESAVSWEEEPEALPEEVPAVLAAWVFVDGTLPVKATDGIFKENSSFSHYSKTSVSFSTNTTVWTDGWDNATTTDKYWKIVTSTKGYKDISLGFQAYGTAKSPKDFMLEYSTDGVAFTAIEAYVVPAAIGTIAFTPSNLAVLADLEQVTLRLRVTSTVSIDGNVVGASNANSRIANISISGIAADDTTTKAPTATPAAGAYLAKPASIALASGTADAAIYYTVDGAEPTISSTPYSAPIDTSALSLPFTIKAISVKGGLNDSAVTSFAYTQAVLAAPTATPVAGAVLTKPATITLSALAGASIYYTTDGGAPTTASNRYSAPIDTTSLTLPITIKAIASKDGVDSTVASIVYTQQMETLISPTANPAAGKFLLGAFPTTVTLSGPADTSIHYTTNGSVPTSASTQYAGAIDISGLAKPVTIKAIAVKAGANDSAVASFVYAVEKVKPTSYNTDGEKGTVAGWNISAVPSTALVPATEGAYKATATFGATVKGVVKTTTFSSEGMSTNGFDTAAGNAYWQVATSTNGFTNFALSFRMRSSATGPREFKLQYSTNGSLWQDTGIQQYNTATSAWEDKTVMVVPSALALTLDSSLFKADFAGVQKDISDEDTLYLRLLLNTNKAASNTADIASSGSNTINNIMLTGEYILEDNQVLPVEADKTGTAPLGAVINLSSETAGAAIEVSYDEGATFTPVAGGAVTLDTLPKTFQARATKASMTTSRVKTFAYTQTKVARVQAAPSGGAVVPETPITLTAPEVGAVITYTLTEKVGIAGEEGLVGAANTTYTAPILLPDGGFPYKLVAKATAPGCLDSEAMTWNYTYKKPAGGEENYFGQLHAHTTLSDGAGEVEEAFEYANRTADLDFFAVTDHSNSYDTATATDTAATYNLYGYNASNPKWIRGHDAADAETAYAAANSGGDFVGMYGYEMTWSGGPGHINTFNTEGFVSRLNAVLNNKTSDAGMRAYYELLKATPESISQFNHPGTTFGNFTNFSYYDPLIDNQISLVEIGNGEGTIGSGGYFPSYEQYTMALDKGWHVAPTNNQDNHKKGWGTSNTCRTVVWTNDFTREGVYTAMREMRVYATEVSDLDITYTLNDKPLGSQLDVPATANFKAEVKNGTAGNTVKSISLITTGGVEVGKQTFTTKDASYTHTIETPAAGYYYLKVIDLVGGQERTAVTAPVWLGRAEAVGITDFKKSTDLPVTTEELTLTTGFFNNEATAATLTAIEYAVEGGAVIATETPNTVIAANGDSLSHTARFTPTVVGNTTLTVKATIEIGGNSKTYTNSLTFKVTDIDEVVFVGIDGSHRNEYVSGNYKDSMGNFTTMAAGYGVRTVTLNTSEELLAALVNPKYVAMFLTAPSRRLLPYTDSKVYSETELAALKGFAAMGKTIVVAGWSDSYENYADFKATGISHMAEEQNRLLAALGSSLRLGDDAAGDSVLNPSDMYRLYLEGDSVYNYTNPYMAGVVASQQYSNYGGSTVYAVDKTTGAAVSALPASVSPMVYGLSTTTSVDRDADGFGLPGGSALPRYGAGAGQVLMNASETLQHGSSTSTVIVAGAAFMSNFEIQIDMDNLGTLPYSNYTILSNLVESVSPQGQATSILDAKSLPLGTEVTIEGIATAGVNTQSVNAATNKGFFDSIYVQDATGGINLFPVASGVTEGQRIRIRGTISEYQGEKQVAVTRLSVRDAAINRVAPTTMTTAATMDPANTGLLVKTKGIVSDIVKDGGKVAQFKVNDSSGAAIVYLNGYITPGVDLNSIVTNGAEVWVSGLASIGENYADSNMLPRIRVRDRGEIVAVVTTVSVTGVNLNNTSLSLNVGEKATLAATVAPANATNKQVSWTSSNNAVATVASGVVTAVQSGTATITVTTLEGGFRATCQITVKAVPASVQLNNTSLALDVGKKATLTATVLPADASNKTVTWASSNPAVAAVVNGGVTAVKSGTAIITVSTVEGGKTASCKVTVSQPATGVVMNMSTKYLAVGKSIQLKATLQPTNTTNKTLKWKSSSTKIATVTDKGKVVAKKIGKTTITVTAANGKKATAVIHVTKKPVSVSSVKLSANKVNLKKGKSVTLKLTVAPSTASDKKVKWTTSDPKVATVASNGKVVAKGKGTATITVTSNESGKTAKCTVKVT